MVLQEVLQVVVQEVLQGVLHEVLQGFSYGDPYGATETSVGL